MADGLFVSGFVGRSQATSMVGVKILLVYLYDELLKTKIVLSRR